MSKHRAVLLIGLLLSVTMVSSSADASYPLAGTLPKEQNILLFCSVDDTLMAKDCGPQPGTPSSAVDKRTSAFIQVEGAAPDYLAGATPGSHVLVIVRRSTASPLDEVNPGRAVAPKTPTSQPVTNADWVSMPNSRDIEGYFPERALRLSTSGSATTRCTVGTQGDLLGCWLTNETPSAFSFGAAALRLTTFVQMKSTAKDGSATVGHDYIMNVAFDARSGKITLSGGQ